MIAWDQHHLLSYLKQQHIHSAGTCRASKTLSWASPETTFTKSGAVFQDTTKGTFLTSKLTSHKTVGSFGVFFKNWKTEGQHDGLIYFKLYSTKAELLFLNISTSFQPEVKTEPGTFQLKDETLGKMINNWNQRVTVGTTRECCKRGCYLYPPNIIFSSIDFFVISHWC